MEADESALKTDTMMGSMGVRRDGGPATSAPNTSVFALATEPSLEEVIKSSADVFMMDDDNQRRHAAAVEAGASVFEGTGYCFDGDESEEEGDIDEAIRKAEEELAQMQLLASEFEVGQAARAAALPKHEIAPDEEAMLKELADTFNRDRRPGIQQLTLASRRVMKVTMSLQLAVGGEVAVELPGRREPLRISQDADLQVDETGGTVWEGGRALARWLDRALTSSSSAGDACDAAADPAAAAKVVAGLRTVRTAIELGCGCGLVSLVLATAADATIQKVVATDGEGATCELARANARANGVDSSKLAVTRLWWGEHAEAEEQVEAVLSACYRHGEVGAPVEAPVEAGAAEAEASALAAAPVAMQCAELVVAADVLYTAADGKHNTTSLFEWTLRRLLRAGGCRYVVLGWYERSGEEGRFLDRFKDVGEVCTLWTGVGEGSHEGGKMGVHCLVVATP